MATGVADIADDVVGERRMGAHLHRRAVLGMDHPAADQIADLVLGELRAGEHADDAGHRLGLGDVDRLDLGMGVRASARRPRAHAGHAMSSV